jgi:hypothetical protein
MLFDLRGKRKRVVQVIYAMLALLMGGGLVLFGIGSSNAGGGLLDAIGIGGNSSNSSRGNDYDAEAARIEKQVAANPKDEALLLKLARQRILAGNSKSPADSSTGQQVFSEESVAEFQQAADAWEKYLKADPATPDSAVALLMANSYISLAQSQSDLLTAIDDVKSAAKAQKIYADAKPSLGSLSQLALYDYLVGDVAAADAAGAAAIKLSDDANREQLKARLKEAKKEGQQLQKQAKAAAKKKGQGGLENPLGGLGSGGGIGAPGATP